MKGQLPFDTERWGGATYFDLQNIISSKTLVVHLMIRVISIATTLILYECKSKILIFSSRHEPCEKGTLTDDWTQCVVLECHNEQDVHTFSERHVRIDAYRGV